MTKPGQNNHRKVIRNRVGKDCPKCGHALVYRINSTTSEKFIGCSNYPKCDYKPLKGALDFACESLGVEWRPNLDREVLDIFYDITHGALAAKGSSDEVEYLLGAAYYLDHYAGNSYNNADGIRLYKAEVQYLEKKYNGIGFFQPYSYWGGGIEPSAMAFVPQLEFAQIYHHDFGVFFSGERFPKPTDWDFELAVEVDIFYTHQLFPGYDKNRDLLVNYPVLRLHPKTEGSEPLKWFRKVMTHWAHKFYDP